jgi:glutamyl/glutaminyl-tRNA synthetase
VNPDYVQDIFDTLNFLQIPWDEGPRNYGDYEREFSQLRRLELYRGTLEQLWRAGKLFACVCSRATVMRDSGDGGYPGTCSEKGLAFDTKDCNWRLRTGEAELPAEVRDFIVRKKDGSPAYQLTSVMDDLHFGIDMVVRGEDLRSSTLAQQWLALQLGQELGSGFEKIHFYHHALLMESEDRKLSKSAGATSVRYLRQQGRKPAEVFAMIAEMLEMDGRPGNWKDLVAGMGLE